VGIQTEPVGDFLGRAASQRQHLDWVADCGVARQGHRGRNVGIGWRSGFTALLLNVGSAHRPKKKLQTGSRLSTMIVTSNLAESGCHEDSMLVLPQVCHLDLLGAFLL
jgi:hypothetical protein